jgi:predicted Ser/Thr protein kinase
MDETLGVLRQVEAGIREEFVANKRVLSFDDYFAMVMANPVAHTRTAARYLRDCMEHYGRVEVARPEGPLTRFSLFDIPWEGGRHRLVGQEQAQGELFAVLNNFVRDGRVTRLVLLHGPNGSAKSSLIACLARALEDYSTHDEGAQFKFSWVFPTSATAKKRLGFGGAGRPDALGSYALLEEEDIAALLPADLSDHPLLLLPRARRARIFEALRRAGALGPDHSIGEYLLDGDLSPRSRAVADALLNSYKGDFQRLLQHIRVERYYFSRRYRRGLVTVEPQLHVDATIRQVTMDQGLASLPPALRNLNLFEPQGDLVDANRGLLEYNDLLKKPVDAFKYLLATCEKGTVTLPSAILHLDQVFIASSNEAHLAAFKQYPDFTSFKGRMDLVKMPYLRDYTAEQGIYDEQIREQGLSEPGALRQAHPRRHRPHEPAGQGRAVRPGARSPRPQARATARAPRRAARAPGRGAGGARLRGLLRRLPPGDEAGHAACAAKRTIPGP